MSWVDFWEALDGRLWWELRKAGAPDEAEPKTEKTEQQIAEERKWLAAKAQQLGWIDKKTGV